MDFGHSTKIVPPPVPPGAQILRESDDSPRVCWAAAERYTGPRCQLDDFERRPLAPRRPASANEPGLIASVRSGNGSTTFEKGKDEHVPSSGDEPGQPRHTLYVGRRML